MKCNIVRNTREISRLFSEFNTIPYFCCLQRRQYTPLKLGRQSVVQKQKCNIVSNTRRIVAFSSFITMSQLRCLQRRQYTPLKLGRQSVVQKQKCSIVCNTRRTSRFSVIQYNVIVALPTNQAMHTWFYIVSISRNSSKRKVSGNYFITLIMKCTLIIS